MCERAAHGDLEARLLRAPRRRISSRMLLEHQSSARHDRRVRAQVAGGDAARRAGPYFFPPRWCCEGCAGCFRLAAEVNLNSATEAMARQAARRSEGAAVPGAGRNSAMRWRGTAGDRGYGVGGDGGSGRRRRVWHPWRDGPRVKRGSWRPRRKGFEEIWTGSRKTTEARCPGAPRSPRVDPASGRVRGCS